MLKNLFNKPKRLLALDIDEFNIRLLETSYFRGRREILCADTIATPQDAYKDGEIIAPEKIAKIFLTQKYKAKEIAVALPSSCVTSKVVAVNTTCLPHEQRLQAWHAIKDQVSFELSDISIEFILLNADASPVMQKMLVVICHKRYLTPLINLAKFCKRKLTLIDVDSVVYGRLIQNKINDFEKHNYLLAVEREHECAIYIYENGVCGYLKIYKIEDLSCSQAVINQAYNYFVSVIPAIKLDAAIVFNSKIVPDSCLPVINVNVFEGIDSDILVDKHAIFSLCKGLCFCEANRDLH